jgi:DNA-directed RNA polymerase sigma subunit (sigma70/sigma32)
MIPRALGRRRSRSGRSARAPARATVGARAGLPGSRSRKGFAHVRAREDELREALSKLTRAHAALASELGREPWTEELAVRTGLPVGKVDLLLAASRPPASLEAPVGEHDDTPLGHMVPDVTTASPEAEAICRELATEVERARGPLGEREREVLRPVRLRPARIFATAPASI